MQRPFPLRAQTLSTFLVLTAMCAGIPLAASAGSTAGSDTATTKLVAAAAAPSAEDVSDLKAQMAAMKAKIDAIEAAQTAAAAASRDAALKAQAAADAAAKARVSSAGNGVHVGSAGSDVRLYGLLEATLGGNTNTTTTGAPQIGLPISWFSGNRWGLDITQRLSHVEDGKPLAPNQLNLIAKLESEFELPSGNMDTAGVLFNRDAWIGLQSATLGKFTIGRQNALPRDVAAIWGDPYGNADNTTNEGGFSNTNNFKQFIYYASGGNSASGQGDTRYDAAFVWKKVLKNGLFLAAAYNFGDANGPGGPNGSGPIPGAEFNKGSSVAGGIGLNAGRFHTSAFYTTSNVLMPKTIGTTNVGHEAESVGLGGNYDWGRYRLNAGYVAYAGDQAALGRRYDKAWTLSAKVVPTRRLDYELGVQEFIAHNAAVNGSGYVLRPFRDATSATKTINGTRFTVYGSVIEHVLPNVEVYLVGDDLLTGGGYLDSRANGYRHAVETATGLRFRF